MPLQEELHPERLARPEHSLGYPTYDSRMGFRIDITLADMGQIGRKIGL